MSIWLTIVACGLITFAIRLSFIAVEGKLTIPRWFRALLPFVPVATLTALIVPDVNRRVCDIGAVEWNQQLIFNSISHSIDWFAVGFG